MFLLGGTVLAAGITQLAGNVYMLHRSGLAIVPDLTPILPAVRRIAKLFLPMLIPLGILQFGAFFDRIYAWSMSGTPAVPSLFLLGWEIPKPLKEGAVTMLYGANRLYQFPLGVLAISLATAVFPLFSRYASRGDRKGLRDATNLALRLSLFLGIPAGVGLILLAVPAVRLVCRRFEEWQILATANILRMYCVGMWAYFCNHILLRAFFAQEDTRTPLRVSCIMVTVNMLLVITLVFTPLGVAAIGLATACTAMANVAALVWVLRRRRQQLGLDRILLSLIPTGLATAAMATGGLGGLAVSSAGSRGLADQATRIGADPRGGRLGGDCRLLRRRRARAKP